MRVIELNDASLRVIDAEGVIVSSPGFALLDGKQLQLGEAAESQARLRPTQSYNKFWQQLSLEPLSNTPPTVRHFADMAFAHLQQVAQAADVSGDVILAVPGHFSHQQLAILLGLVRHSPFNAVGVVDAAVAAAAALARDEAVIYADMQLHQVLLTRLSQRDGVLQRDAVLQIPGVGSHNFMDLLMQLATSLFIQQSRFNPQHNAESEQQLYNELPRWLRQSHDVSSNLMMELTFGNSVYQAKLPGENLVRRLGDYYSRINDKIRTLADNDACQLLVAQNLAQYPGYLNSLGSTAVEVVAPESLGRNCILLHEHIGSPAGEFRFVTRLPLVRGNQGSPPQPATSAAAIGSVPTHVLVGHQALPLGRVEVSNGKTRNGSPLDGHVIQLELTGLPDHLGHIERQDGQVIMSCGNAGALVNGVKVSGRQTLQLGDRIRFAPSGEELVMIGVQNGQA
jgi:hypothetical protein